MGIEEVFDITVDGLHNFVADNIVVHNSIEQDADLVAFLFREDYYRDPDDEPDGLADVIIAKHRNGPIGTPKLVFLDRFPKVRRLRRPGAADRAARRRRAAARGRRRRGA